MNSQEHVLFHVGCGRKTRQVLPPPFNGPGWREIRIDLDASVHPDIVASLTALEQVPSDSGDALWCSHMLEHLDAHEVGGALAEVLRVLKPGGMLFAMVPDAQVAARMVAEDRGDEPIYQSRMGPITALDMLYGHGASLAAGHRTMAHRTCFTARTLGEALKAAGFRIILLMRRDTHEIVVKAMKPTGP